MTGGDEEENNEHSKVMITEQGNKTFRVSLKTIFSHAAFEDVSAFNQGKRDKEEGTRKKGRGGGRRREEKKGHYNQFIIVIVVMLS